MAKKRRTVQHLERELRLAEIQSQIRTAKVRSFISVALPGTLLVQIFVFDVLVLFYLLSGRINTESGVLETFIGSMLLHLGALVMVIVKRVFATEHSCRPENGTLAAKGQVEDVEDED